MNSLRFCRLGLIFFCVCALPFFSQAADDNPPAQETPPSSDPVVPVPRDRDYSWMTLAQWQQTHAELSALAARGEAELVFLGDSITASTRSSESWKKVFGGYRYANFGIGGDRTQNVLWRLDHGEVGALKPKVIVLLIGTNNIGITENDVDDTVRGVTAVVKKIHTTFPTTKLLVLGLFPRDEKPDTSTRVKISQINAALAKLEDGKSTFVRDIGKVFLESDGILSTEISPDHLHLSEEGLRRWAEAIAPTVRQLMR
jgi:lysophospholipase L1-like esterase